MTALAAKSAVFFKRVVRLVVFSLVLCAALRGSADAQELRILTSPWPPSNYLDENGHPTGISVAIVSALKAKLGLPTTVEVLPWARGYKMAQTTPNIMLFTGAKTQERIELGFEFLGPAVMWTHGLLSKQGSSLKIDNLDDVRSQGLTAVGVRGSWQVKLLKEAGIETVETADHQTSARMLMAGRVDLWFTSQLQASVVLQGLGLPASAATSVFTVRKSPSYLMISGDSDPELVEKWRKAFEELKQSDIPHAIAKDWSNRLGTPLIYQPDEGFSADLSRKGRTG